MSASTQELLADLIVSLDRYAAGDGWPGWWGPEGPEYLTWLEEQPESQYPLVMGANTYRVLSEMSGSADSHSDFSSDETETFTGLDAIEKTVFSTTLREPLAGPIPNSFKPTRWRRWANLSARGISPCVRSAA